MSDETDSLADMGAEQEAADFLREKGWLQQRGNGSLKEQRRRNRDNMRRKRLDPAYKEAERIKNRDRMRKMRGLLTIPK